MRHVYLPTEHSDDDLVLAGQVAELLECETLYVTWSAEGYVNPRVEALLRSEGEEEPAVAPPAPRPSLLAEIVGTMAAFVAAIFAPRQPTGTGRPAA